MAFGRRRRREADEELFDDEQGLDDGYGDDHDHDRRGHLHLPHRHDGHAAGLPPSGPYDITDAPRDDIQRLDAGALRVPALEGTQIQFQLEETTGTPISVMVTDGQSGMELAAFAAPKSSGLWDGVRAEIVEQLEAAGGTPRTVDGKFGRELELVLPTPVPGQMVPGRMIGVDGPRWFVRAVVTGPGALDISLAPLLYESLRRLVVVRGDEAMPVRDPLPLRLPKELVDHLKAAQEADGTGTDSNAGQAVMPAGPGQRIAEVR